MTTTITRSRGQASHRPPASSPSRWRQAAFSAAALPRRASGSVRRRTVSPGSSISASTAAVPSEDPSSMTTIALFAASTASRRPTLSAIVSSSFNAGTRNTHRNVSAPAASGEGARARARRDATKRAVVHPRPATIRTKATQKSAWMMAGSPSNGSATAISGRPSGPSPRADPAACSGCRPAR